MNIEELVEKYRASRDVYIKHDYNETQLRTDFLDPFFELLGWDIKNDAVRPTNEREVLVEEGLKADADSNTKKPDYTFRLFGARKFFVEAKKPHVQVTSDGEAARQIRRYGFTAKLKVSVLSNFENLIIYDCSKAVRPDDTSTVARIKTFHFTEYVEAFDEIAELLGQSAVYDGRFDANWKHIEAQLQRSSVDDLFLKQINEWRLSLGREFYQHKPDLDADQLNDLVQRYINSLIFLRVCEDRQLEVYKTLLSCAKNDNFSSLISVLKQADKKYNAGLFEHLLADELIAKSRSSFWEIIEQLYYPESPYSFAVFASDILGNIYEIFLSEQLNVQDGIVTLKRKPEHVDRDVVTTPTFIIQDLLRETVTAHCAGKSDIEILSSTFADIACGSGAFLLETYQLIHDILVDYHMQNSPTVLIQTSADSYKLPFELKRAIVEKCLFGVDKDYNAVEACKFGLLLKLLEDENVGSISAPALPNIDARILFGNSLVEPEQTKPGNRIGINPLSFGELKFDVVIGNPPYMSTEHMKEFTPTELPIYKAKYATSYKQFDKYFLFIERGLSLLKEGGFLGYIVPNKFSKVGAGKQLRKLLLEEKSVRKIVSFGANQVFKDKTTYTCFLILRRSPAESLEYIEVEDLNQWKTRKVGPEQIDSVKISDLSDDRWVLVPGTLRDQYEEIVSQSLSLQEIFGSEAVYNGIQTSANSVYVQSATREDDTYFYFKKDGTEWQVEKALTRPYFKTSSGDDNLNTYRPFSPNSFVFYPYMKTDKGLEFVELSKLKKVFPAAYKFLMHYRAKLDNETRDIKPTPLTENEWYRYGRHQSLEKCDVPAKIIVGVLSQGDKYAIDYFGTLISSGGTAGYCMITLPDSAQYSIYYVQALLNSKYLEWFSALTGEVFRGGYIARGTKVLKELPIRTIDFNCEDEKSYHDKIASLQQELIELQGAIDQNTGDPRKLTPLKRLFDEKKQKMDQALKTLYGLANDDLIPILSKAK